MNKEECVPYEIALELKELGFKEECFGHYYHDNYHCKTPEKKDWEWDITTPQTAFKRWYRDTLVLAILWQQAFEFFRVKHNLHSWIQVGSEYIQIPYINNGHTFSLNECGTYKEAQINCLKKLIEIVKANKINS